MNTSVTRNRNLVAAAVAGLILLGAAASADAQAVRSLEERSKQEHAQKTKAQKEQMQKEAEHASLRYTEATRKVEEARASRSMSGELKDMLQLYQTGKGAEALVVVDQIIANEEEANAYDRSFAAQLGAQVAYKAGDFAAAEQYLEQVLQFNGLDNVGHYDSMIMLAQLRLQEKKYDEALQTIERFLEETRSTAPEHLVLKGNALYRLERHEEAAAVLEQAIAASEAPPADWTQLLMATYASSGQQEKAAQLAEQLTATSSGDKASQMNLAAVYQQSGQYDKMAQVLEQLRASGQLTEDHDYRLLFSAYLSQEGQEGKAIEVINEGFAKGVLKPDFQSYVALAQAHYFSDQIGPALEAYKKAAPLDENGSTYLNLARLLWQEGRVGEAKAAAKQALAEGVDDAEDANKILALPGG